MEKTHPFCESNPVHNWDAIGARDTIQYYNGIQLHREFTEWNIGTGYSLKIGTKQNAKASVDWKIVATGKNSSELQIAIHLIPDEMLKAYPKILRGLICTLYVIPTMKQYVASVVKGFQFYLATGKTVSKNQFGYNTMFSTR